MALRKDALCFQPRDVLVAWGPPPLCSHPHSSWDAWPGLQVLYLVQRESCFISGLPTAVTALPLRGSHSSVQITAIPCKSPCLPLPAESKGSQVMRGTNSAFLIEIACALLACSSTDTLLKPLSVAHLCVGMQGQASRVLLRCRDQSRKQSIGATGNQRLEGGRSKVNIVIYFMSKMNVAGG